MAVFQDVIGQEQLKEHLQNAIRTGKISHAYIINGERFAGKEFIAKIFAAALQCEKGGVEPCGECHSCKQAMSNNHPDIIRVTHEKPGSIGVDDIRSQINGDIAIKPYSSPHKIYIMNEAEKMTPGAQNALLKTLEEPPEYAIIILLTTNVNSLLQTILSRCVVLNMKPVADEQVKKYLMEEMHVPDYRAEVCVAFARGNIGRARQLAVSEDFEKVKEEALSLVKYVHEMDASEMSAAVKKVSEYKMDVDDYLDILSIWYRDALLFKATNDANHLVFKEEIQNIKKVASRTSYEGMEKVINSLQKAKKRLDANVNFDLTMELLLLDMKENG
ncbi:MAG: DNA polymerase III subunit delta' [Lachnospiraceae bacterium]